jgi:hypothetical protein
MFICIKKYFLKIAKICCICDRIVYTEIVYFFLRNGRIARMRKHPETMLTKQPHLGVIDGYNYCNCLFLLYQRQNCKKTPIFLIFRLYFWRKIWSWNKLITFLICNSSNLRFFRSQVTEYYFV